MPFEIRQDQRLLDHNDGCNPATASARPWRVKGYVAFDDKFPG